MRFLFLSETGDGLGLALRLKDGGHTVGVHIKDKRSKLNYEGLLHKPADWQKDFLTKDTIVIFDSNGGGKTGDGRAGGFGRAAAQQVPDGSGSGRSGSKLIWVKACPGAGFAYCPAWTTFPSLARPWGPFCLVLPVRCTALACVVAWRAWRCC